uniref:EIF-4F 25 kDa subunit n=1 Tax=Macrostomum lignano TaxID=282301 RepID=A0A1I8IXC6_9PLAT
KRTQGLHSSCFNNNNLIDKTKVCSTLRADGLCQAAIDAQSEHWVVPEAVVYGHKLLKFFKKDAVNTAEDIAEEPQAFVKTASEIQEDDCDDKPTTEVEDTEGKDMTAADQQENDRDSAKESGCDLALKLGKPEVIHPLQNSWGIWCFMQNRSQDWHENVRHISNFSSVEDFWSLFNHIQTVDNLPVGCDYYIFKASIQPMWEDRANINGGRWLLKVPHSHPTFVQLWIETLLLLVGEAFESESESVCGAVAQVRRGFNKISIWTRDAANRGACMRIGYRWKACLKAAAPIHYEAHLEVNRKNGRRSKSVYSIN